VGTGLNLYGQILQDMITFSRPISGPWDVGAYQFSSPTSYIKNETCKINTIKKMPLKVEVINVLGSQVRNNRKSPCGIYFQKIGNQTQKFCRFGLSFPK
jgi:hypothetical protein